MIDCIYLKNFKNFEELSLSGLKKLNIIVGKNNIGKTNLLESIFIGSNPTNLYNFIQLIVSRMKNFNPKILECFFYNNKEFFEINLANKIKGKFFLDYSDTEIKGIKSIVENKEYVLQILEILNNEIDNRLFFRKGQITFNQVPYPKKIGFSTKFIFFDNVFDNAHLLSELLKKGYREDILSVFNEIFNKNIVNIFPDTDTLRIFVEEKNLRDEKLTIPLSFYGSGTIRLFSIWLNTLQLYENGNNLPKVLLIDEIENGLHYEVKPLIWKLLFKVMEDFGIQLFITTHDEEIFFSIFQLEESKKYKEDILLLRLGEKKVGYYDFDMLNYLAEKRKELLEDLWEIRG